MAQRAFLLAALDRFARLRLRGSAPPAAALVEQASALAEPEGGCALDTLLGAMHREAALSAFGRLAAEWDIARFLTNLRRLREEEARRPAILGEPIAAPLIVTGLPRSGTSFLHGLLAEDPENQTLRCWQAVYPYPDEGAEGRKDRRQGRVDWQLRSFGLIAPDLRNLHPLDSSSPQECTEITAHVFQSLRFDTTHHVPSYRRWLDTHGHAAAYRFHRRFLQHLQHQSGRRRWVLKSPDHVFALDALHAAYPDARLVFVHRDPIKILPSVARLTEVLRRPFTERTDALQIGRQVMDDWTLGAERMMQAGRQWPYPSPPPFHVQYREIVSRPLETVRRLYTHFGMTLGADAAGRIAQATAERPDGGYGRNVYSLADYGFEADALRERFRGYMAQFDVVREAPSAAAAAA